MTHGQYKLGYHWFGSLQWRENGRGGVSNHQPHDYLLHHLFTRRSKKTSKPRVTGHSAGNSPMTGEFPEQRASDAENVSIWWRHHVVTWRGLNQRWQSSTLSEFYQDLHKKTVTALNLIRFKSDPLAAQSAATQQTHYAIMTSLLRQNDVILT